MELRGHQAHLDLKPDMSFFLCRPPTNILPFLPSLSFFLSNPSFVFLLTPKYRQTVLKVGNNLNVGSFSSLQIELCARFPGIPQIPESPDISDPPFAASLCAAHTPAHTHAHTHMHAYTHTHTHMHAHTHAHIPVRYAHLKLTTISGG